ncbi:MAG: transglycosylase SLT domain-containing protein [Bacteroidota bacterium]
MQFFISILFTVKFLTVPPDSNSMVVPASSSFDLRQDIISVRNFKTQEQMDFVFNTQVYQLGCDTMPNVIFWRRIMKLHKDSALFNTPANRNVLSQTHINKWEEKDLSQKSCYKDSLRSCYCLEDSARILLTNGKSFFYDFEKASANFHRGINDFVANGVDPWYAQAILMIESPNKLQKSNAGAYGSFQLMKDVARLFGLKVNKQIDERADFDRSAYAASSLIKKICIPKTRQILDSLGITGYQENELWFRLLVMHSYHAGAGNVRKALFTFRPTEGNMNLIYTLWRTETKQFRSASQNYSQLVLAALLEVNEKFNMAPHQLTIQPKLTENVLR